MTTAADLGGVVTASARNDPSAQVPRGGNVVITNSGEMARACIGFTDDVLAGLLTHADSDNGDLDAAVDGARRRPIGDAGGYAWDRRDGTVHPGAYPRLLSTAAAHQAPEPRGEEPPPTAARRRWSRCRACAKHSGATRPQCLVDFGPPIAFGRRTGSALRLGQVEQHVSKS
jgi:hypothetical protein